MDKLPLAIAAVRLDQARRLYKRIKAGKPIEGIGALICVTDIADGIIMRGLGADGPARRILDSSNDAIILTAGLAALYQKKEKTRPYILALATRELFVGTGYTADLIQTRQVKKGDNMHKLASLSIAAFANAATRSDDIAMHVTGVAAVGINSVLAVDYYSGWKHPDNNVILETGVHEVAGFKFFRNLIQKHRVGNDAEVSAPHLTVQ